MGRKISYCRELGISRDDMVDIICDMNEPAGPISHDYIRHIANAVAESVAEDVYETADGEDWGNDDVRLAFGRVLMKRLRIEV